MNDQRMIRIFLNSGYSDSMVGEDFSMEKFVIKMKEDGYALVGDRELGEGYIPASEIKCIFTFRAANPPTSQGNIIVFPKPVT